MNNVAAGPFIFSPSRLSLCGSLLRIIEQREQRHEENKKKTEKKFEKKLKI